LYQNLRDFSLYGSAHVSSSTTLDAFDEVDPMFIVPWGGVPHPRGSFSVQDRRQSVQSATSAVEHRRRPTLDIIREPVQEAIQFVTSTVKNSEMAELYEKAKLKGQTFQRKPWVQKVFEYSIYTILILFVYFVLVGRPLWNGAVWWLWWVVQNKFVISGGFSITVGLAAM